MKRNKGFTLIELMIVVAIIAIIAAIAIPNLLRSRMTANEATAAGSTRTISTAEVQAQASAIQPDPQGMGQYVTLATLGAQTPPFIDSVLALGNKSGYNYVTAFNGQVAGFPQYQLTVTPLSANQGTKAYFVDDSGVITFTSDGSAPTAASFPIQ